ncbi:hypothetical protein SAMN05216389_10641 [Oceanobacillus limi]|uniref:Zinc-finger n=1 Tax=Oceanobacillus limi TaxID=930131 RepID=A0A1I0C5P9_9BACI|nr:hypothetical protein [Oceanobacillus limi]SET14674.1 hypothetical protein SAMN05216389_10641 [Oceanobacillus limi]
MGNSEKLHTLAYELLPLYQDLDANVKKVINEHVEECDVCKGHLDNVQETFGIHEEPIDEQVQYIEKVKPSPFKKLILFKRSLLVLMLMVRFLILGMIIYLAQSYLGNASLITSSVILFYFPFVCLTNAVHYLFFKSKLFWIIISFDILILLFFDNLLISF